MVVIALTVLVLAIMGQLIKTRNVVILWIAVSASGVGLAIASHWR